MITTLLIGLIVIAIVATIFRFIPLPQPLGQVVYIVFAIIVLIWLIHVLLPGRLGI